MLARTAANLYWMARSIERIENSARMINTVLLISLTQLDHHYEQWRSLLRTSGMENDFFQHYDAPSPQNVIDFMMRNKHNPSSIISLMENARHNARVERNRLSRESFEAINNTWTRTNALFARPITSALALDALDEIRDSISLIRGTWYGTMLRSDIFDFTFLGTFIERADNTARILDVKYYLLLPSASMVGSGLDNTQWESILRTFSALRAFNWIHQGQFSAAKIAHFLILDLGMPRSLSYCYHQLTERLKSLDSLHDHTEGSHASVLCQKRMEELRNNHINHIFQCGLHEYIQCFIERNNTLGVQIAKDYHLL